VTKTTTAKIDALMATFTPGVGKTGCVDFSPRVGPYTWSSGRKPTAAFIDQLLTIIQTQTSYKCIMIYDIWSDILRVAHAKGFKVLGIIWLTTTASDNSAAISRAITASRDYASTIVGFTCGSELAFREGTTTTVSNILANCLSTLRGNGVTHPIGYIDSLKTYNAGWSIANNADFLGVNIYPWYDNVMTNPTCTTPAEAASETLARFQRVQARYPTKKFILTETGWPGAPSGKTLTYGCGLASDKYQKQVIGETVELFRKNNLPMSTFSAFREADKDPTKLYKNHWGVCLGAAPYTCVSQPKAYVAPTLAPAKATTAKPTTKAPVTTAKPTTKAPTPKLTTKAPVTTAKPTTKAPTPKPTPAPARSCASGWSYYGGNCYKVTQSGTFAATQQICATLGASIAVVQSALENSFLTSVTPTIYQSCWLGYKKSGTKFVTTAGATMPYTNWKADEPNLANGCVTQIRDPLSINVKKWKTDSCTVSRIAVCKKPV
jgi:exo-beta-1,3-glucanase (GH17 family)